MWLFSLASWLMVWLQSQHWLRLINYPETEIAWPWLATCLGVTLTLLTLNEWTFANSGFILYIFTINLMIFVCVQFKLESRLKKLAWN